MKRYLPFLIVALPLALALGARSCLVPKPAAHVEMDASLATLIPPDTTILAAIDFDGLRKTALYQKHMADREIPQLDHFAKSTGIDPRKDLWQLLFLSDGRHNILFGRGKYKEDMESYLQREGAQVFPYKMYHLVGQEQAAVVFLNTTTAAAGSVESLKAFLDARGKSNGPPPAIAERIKQLPAGAHVWAIYTGGAGVQLPLPLEGNLANLNRVLANVSSAQFHLSAGDGLHGAFRLEATGDAEAKQLNETLRGLVGFGRLSLPADRTDLLRVFDGLKVSADTAQARLVVLTIEEPQDLIDAFVTSLKH